jgi:hypothetical protein
MALVFSHHEDHLGGVFLVSHWLLLRPLFNEHCLIKSSVWVWEYEVLNAVPFIKLLLHQLKGKIWWEHWTPESAEQDTVQFSNELRLLLRFLDSCELLDHTYVHLVDCSAHQLPLGWLLWDWLSCDRPWLMLYLIFVGVWGAGVAVQLILWTSLMLSLGDQAPVFDRADIGALVTDILADCNRVDALLWLVWVT